MTSATTSIHRSKGFNPAGPHYTGITFKKGHTTPQTAIDRAKFTDCPTGNPTYAPTITSAEYRESVAAYKASGAQRPFCPSTLKTPESDSRIQHEHNLARDRKAAAKVAELAAHTCVDCGLDQMGNGQTIYLRTVESKGTWLEQPSVKAVLCTSCYDARKAVMHAAEEAARIAAHCSTHTDYLLRSDGSCPECSRIDQETAEAAECALTHSGPRILVMAGGSQDAPAVCPSCLKAAERNLHAEDRYDLTAHEIEATALAGYSLSHACESPTFCQCGYADHPTPPEPPAPLTHRPPMSPELRQARAINKANAQRAHVRSLQGRPGFYLVRSATDPHERYVVSVSPETGAIECSCKAGSEYKQPCWHAAKVQSRIIRESRKVAA